jgi:hypothetical protein
MSCKRQGGFSMVLTLLALIVLAWLAGAKVYSDTQDHKRALGQGEAGSLELLKVASNKAIFDHLIDLQRGANLRWWGPTQNKASDAAQVDIAPKLGLDGEPHWQVSLGDLRAMGYLPASFNLGTSTGVNAGTYAIEFGRALITTPGGILVSCVATLPGGVLEYSRCQMQGMVWITLPIASGGQEDASITAPLLTRLGADGGMSLDPSIMKSMDPTQDRTGFIAGYGRKWFMRNPVAGQPVGVVAVRIGGNTAGFEELVRMGEQRDIVFGGNLSLGKNLFVQNDVTVGQAPGTPLGSPPGTNACVRITADGQINVNCQGQVSGNELSLAQASEGAPCTLGAPTLEGKATTRYAALNDGSLGFCAATVAGNQWVAVNRFRLAGADCTAAQEGTSATDLNDRQALVCRSGVYMRANVMSSNFVLIDTLKLNVGITGVAQVAKPTCPASGGLAGQARMMLAPLDEAGLGDYPRSPLVSGINRYAELDDPSSPTWKVHLEKAVDNTPIAGLVQLSIFCFYPLGR